MYDFTIPNIRVVIIDDMMDGMDNVLSEEEKIDKVLRELGNPKELANRYRGRERYLITFPVDVKIVVAFNQNNFITESV